MCTLGPVAEEIFFRGFVFNTLCRWMPMLLAASIQSLVFGFMHAHGGVTYSLVIAAFGLFLALLYRWRKTIVTPIFVHAGYNSLMAISLFIAMQNHADAAVMGVNCDAESEVSIVNLVTANSPAEQAGLQVGDTITFVDAFPIQDFQSLQNTISGYAPGDTVTVKVVRDNESIEFSVTLTSRRKAVNEAKSSRVKTPE